jgi:hypothetical protein
LISGRARSTRAHSHDEAVRLVEVATKTDLRAMEDRMTERMDFKLESMEHRLTAAFERGIRKALVAQTFTVFGGVMALYVLAERFAG